MEIFPKDGNALHVQDGTEKMFVTRTDTLIVFNYSLISIILKTWCEIHKDKIYKKPRSMPFTLKNVVQIRKPMILIVLLCCEGVECLRQLLPRFVDNLLLAVYHVLGDNRRRDERLVGIDEGAGVLGNFLQI